MLAAWQAAGRYGHVRAAGLSCATAKNVPPPRVETRPCQSSTADATSDPTPSCTPARSTRTPGSRCGGPRSDRSGAEAVFGVVTMKPGVTVLPLDDNGDVHLVREFKYALGDYSLEAVSGALECGEGPEQAGMRELAEECGLAAAEWVDMGRINPFTTIIHSPNHMFLARGLLRDRQVRDARTRAGDRHDAL